MVVERVFQRHARWAVDQVGENLPAVGAGTVGVAKDIKPLFDPHDHPFGEQVGDLVARVSVILQGLQQGLIVEFFPGDGFSQFGNDVHKLLYCA
ncbi:MAG: hypothetical protein ACP5FP_06145 [Desulfuromonadaceae bacterium]